MTDIVTPNIKEASVLLGDVPLKSVSDMRTAAKLIHDMGPRFVSFKLRIFCLLLLLIVISQV